ncbi:hypothetical protein [Streptomyces sp. 1222.5]|uniref:hypothetical protein n=1 Tax=Streptomyces sp. 1222.5 TaxID=1881026 RepID=UPI003EBF3C0B
MIPAEALETEYQINTEAVAEHLRLLAAIPGFGDDNMGRISEETRARNEEAIRTAMQSLLEGNVPPGGGVDIKTLAQMSGVPRSGFYSTRGPNCTKRPGPYQHLAEEFNQCRRKSKIISALKGVQVERFEEAVAALKVRLEKCETELKRLKDFQQFALSHIIAQHFDIQSLREQATSSLAQSGRSMTGADSSAVTDG